MEAWKIQLAWKLLGQMPHASYPEAYADGVEILDWMREKWDVTFGALPGGSRRLGGDIVALKSAVK